MKHEMICYVAERHFNNIMSCMDMRPECKWFVTPTRTSFETNTIVNDDYFMNIIEKSKLDEGLFIPAISYMGNFYKADGVKILSDGNTEMFIQEN